MPRFIECTLTSNNPDTDVPETVVLHIDAIESMRQIYDEHGGWIHTEISMRSRSQWTVAHILDEIDATMDDSSDRRTVRVKGD